MNKKDLVKETIIQVAQRIFSKLGYDKTTLELIAKEARKGKSTLYYYFKNKEEIFAAVIEREGNIIQNELLKVVNLNEDTKTILKKYILTRYKLLEKLLNYYNVFKEDYLRNISIIEKYRKKHDEFEFITLKQILLKGISNNELKISEEELDDVVLAIVVALKGLEIPIFVERKITDFEKKIDSLLNVLFYGIAKKYSEECED